MTVNVSKVSTIRIACIKSVKKSNLHSSTHTSKTMSDWGIYRINFSLQKTVIMKWDLQMRHLRRNDCEKEEKKLQVDCILQHHTKIRFINIFIHFKCLFKFLFRLENWSWKWKSIAIGDHIFINSITLYPTQNNTYVNNGTKCNTKINHSHVNWLNFYGNCW